MKQCIVCHEVDELKLLILDYHPDATKTDSWWMCKNCVGDPDAFDKAKETFYGGKRKSD